MKRKLIYNTFFSLLLHIITFICGLITPRLFLNEYGSDVNGLVQSIAQFLGLISFLEFGVGQVIQSALYKPLAEKDDHALSCVLASGNKFFRRIAYMLLAYVLVLIAVYPLVIEQNFDWVYTATLIGAISVGSFAQYYFGIVDKILLNADQRGYIQNCSQIIALIINTMMCVVLILSGFSIQVVKLASSLIFLIRPFIVRLYINKHYCIDRKVVYADEPIKQKWNGVAQHVSGFILNGTDNVILTVFSTLSNVSVYSIYYLVIYGIYQLYQSAMSGLHSLVGDLWAKQELKQLKSIFGMIEVVLHFSSVFLFSCTGILILPFVRVYTDGITDVNYMQPLFSALLVLAYASQCIKTTYNMLILAGGHYKQTQKCHIISAVLNLTISVATVYFWGLVGVAIGTIVAMVYQMVWMAYYDSKHLLKWPFSNFVKQIGIDILTVFLIWISTSWIQLESVSYISWFIMAMEVALIALVITVAMAFLFHRKKMTEVFKRIMRGKKSLNKTISRGRYIIHDIKRMVKNGLSLFSNDIVYFVPKTKEQTVSAEEAESVLEQYSPDPKSPALWNRPEIENDHDLTIIIPVYNVEKYLERCLESVLHQKTDYSYDVIVVNDCSSDNSIRIIERYQDDPSVKVFHHEINRGLSAARNTGLREAQGKYVMFVDSDDFLTENAVEDLMQSAYRHDADIVQGGYYGIDHADKLLNSKNYTNCESVPSNGVLAGMAWGKVYKTKLFDRLCFPEKYWFEDTVVTAILTHLAEKIVTTEAMVYYYRQNPQGITSCSKAHPKAIDTFWVHRCVMEARKELGLVADVKFYEHLLRMVVLSYDRTKLMPDTVRNAMFILFREMLLTVRQDHFVVKKRYKNLDRAISEGDYKRYTFLCKY